MSSKLSWGWTSITSRSGGAWDSCSLSLESETQNISLLNQLLYECMNLFSQWMLGIVTMITDWALQTVSLDRPRPRQWVDLPMCPCLLGSPGMSYFLHKTNSITQDMTFENCKGWIVELNAKSLLFVVIWHFWNRARNIPENLWLLRLSLAECLAAEQADRQPGSPNILWPSQIECQLFKRYISVN